LFIFWIQIKRGRKTESAEVESEYGSVVLGGENLAQTPVFMSEQKQSVMFLRLHNCSASLCRVNRGAVTQLYVLRWA